MANSKRGKTIAVRSDAIIEARFSLTTKQNEIIDMLLCEIEDDDREEYVISVEKYKQFYNSDTSNLYRDMKKAVEGLEGKGFKIYNKESNKTTFIVWFRTIEYIPRKAEIKLHTNKDFKKMLWEVKKKVYYDIKYTLNFNSSYSQRFYYYLKSFEDTGWRIDAIDDLLEKLECPASYKKYSDFKRNVLDIVEKEVNASSDISFTYDPRKVGRKITQVKFTIIQPYYQNAQQKKALTDKTSQLILTVKSFIEEKLSDDSVIELLNVANDNVEMIKEKYIIMKQQKHIDNIVAWLKDAIKYNYKPSVSMKQVDMFNNFDQREYGDDFYTKLEKAHMGYE